MVNYSLPDSDYTGVSDLKCRDIHVGDKVRLFEQEGVVTFCAGAYGIGFDGLIDWDNIEKQLPVITGCNNPPHFLYNDNFISFWELIWNFDCEQDICHVVELVGKEALDG